MAQKKLSPDIKSTSSPGTAKTENVVVRGDDQNPFFQMKKMVLQSLGKLPTSLVMIMVAAAVTASLAGLAVHFVAANKKPYEFMPQRLEIDTAAPALDENMIQGVWFFQDGYHTMTLTLVDQKFEWVVSLADEGIARFYARGNYRVVGNVLIFGQRPDMGKPFDKKNPHADFLPMQLLSMNVFATVDRESLKWEVPVSEQGKFAKGSKPLFDGKDGAHLVWTRVR